MKKKTSARLQLAKQTIHHLKGGIGKPVIDTGNNETAEPSCPSGLSLCPVLSCGVHTGCDFAPADNTPRG
jgi:hypothetical protein